MAFVTLLTDNSYLPGTQVLLHSLRETRTKRALVVMVTSEVSARSRAKLSSADRVIQVEPIPNPHEASDAPWQGSGYTKLRAWELEEYDRVVYIDTDAIVLEPLEELFELRVDFAAAPDVFPPDKFNAGVLVLRPSGRTFEAMMKAAPTAPSHDGGDTGFLNTFFNDWYTGPHETRLPFRYNAQRTMYWMTHVRQPGYWNSIKPIKILHFSSSPKPWEDAKKKGDLELVWWQHYAQMMMMMSVV
ncbi:hypothetical protein CTAYLR_009358 [Chrysophaeum taylorii]|uniref:Glycosyltransferase family 8 protein n=1 Tax=Chrysophaeum taylorii TaxID=2483200 RepID=A0AAD7UJN7_9STRA|nr:hypothetical protein CTAYLR_009358 [Chrysophaeum taylorii]